MYYAPSTVTFPIDLAPVAIFGTIGTYAWRLPGCDLGSTSRKTGESIPPNPGLLRYMQSLVVEEPFEFSFRERAFLLDSTFSFGRQNRIIIDAANFRENHGHVVMYPLFPLPTLASQEAFVTCSKIISDLKNFLTDALRARYPHFRDRKIWSRGYNCFLIFSFRGWYNRFYYTLCKQGSNYYVRYSQFARSAHVQFDAFHEPYERSLKQAFASNRIREYRRKNMPPELQCDDNLFAIADEEGPCEPTALTCPEWQ